MKKNNKNSEIKEGIGKGILSGFFSSLCCVGPLIIVLLGLGSVSFALSISQYKPYFLGIGFLFMIGVIFLHLNKKNKTCKTNCFTLKGLKKERNFIISVILSMVLFYFIALYILMPLISPIIYNNAIQKTQANVNPTNNLINNQNSNLHILNIKINGMTCTGCASGLQSILQGLDGVVKAEVSYSKGTGEVIYNTNRISKEEILNSEAFTGKYSAEVISDEKFNNKK